MSFYDTTIAAIQRQVLSVWPDVTQCLPVPQLQRYNWANLLQAGSITLPVAVIKFDPFNSSYDDSGDQVVFIARATVYYVFAVPDEGLSDQSTIYQRLVDLCANVMGGGIENDVGAVKVDNVTIDGTEKNDLAALFLIRGTPITCGALSFNMQTGFGIIDET